MNSEQRRQYVREVCLALVGKEPEDYRMSVAEFGVIQGWMDRNIPLAVVLQTIEQQTKQRAATGFSKMEKVHNPVLYIKSAVEEEMKRRDKAIV
jgi:hypothetical protein